MKSDFLSRYYVHGKISEGAFDNEFFHMALRTKLKELLKKGETDRCLEILENTTLLHNGEKNQGEAIVLIGPKI